MMFKLRDYQAETIDNINNELRNGNKNIIVQQPPLTGKTVIMAELARRATARGGRVLFIVHRVRLSNRLKQHLKRRA
mgnify:CR=1 FL=1